MARFADGTTSRELHEADVGVSPGCVSLTSNTYALLEGWGKKNDSRAEAAQSGSTGDNQRFSADARSSANGGRLADLNAWLAIW
jgi:hypothetical protein